MAIVGDLVANLTADSTNFVGPMTRAQNIIVNLGKSAQQTAPRFGGLLSSLSGIGVAMGALGAGAAVRGAIAAFRESEQAGKKLDSVLASTGGAAGLTGEEIRQLAGDLQAVTNFEDDATIGAAGVLATFTQIRGDVFKSALMAAQDLSSVMGTDLQSSVVQVGKALNDPIRGITALSRVGVSFSQEQKDQIKRLQESGDLTGAQAVILAELQKEFGGAARAMADPLTIVGNQVGDIAETFGALLLPSVVKVADFLVRELVPGIEKAGPGFVEMGQALADTLGGALEYVRPLISDMVVIASNLGTVWQITFTNAQLAAVSFVTDLSHSLTVTLPGYVSWFADNWRDVFTTIFDFTATVFSNLSTNIGNSMGEIWDYVASGGADAMESAWKPLTDGFESSIKELPKIAEREQSEMEKYLSQVRTALVDDLAGKLVAAAEDAGAGVEKATKPVFTGLGQRAADIVTQTEGQLQAFETKGPSAAMQGSSEALQAIFGAMRQDDLQKQQVRLLQEQNAIGRDQLAAIRDMADADETVGIE